MPGTVSDEDAFDWIRAMVGAGRPCSLVRLGDGEALLLRYPKLASRAEVNFILEMWFGAAGSRLSHEHVLAIRALLIKAIDNADAIGVPTERQCSRAGKKAKNWRYIAKYLDQRPELEGKLFVNHSLHMWMQNKQLFGPLIKGRDWAVVTSRDVAAGMRNKLRARSVEQHLIPEEVFYAETRETVARHYPAFFDGFCRQLRTRPIRRPALVGGGVLGKVYCDVVKETGGAAFDIGSVFDSWARWTRRGSVRNNRQGF